MIRTDLNSLIHSSHLFLNLTSKKKNTFYLFINHVLSMAEKYHANVSKTCYFPGCIPIFLWMSGWTCKSFTVPELLPIVPLKEPKSIRGRPALLEAHSRPDTWVTINNITKMRMYLQKNIMINIRIHVTDPETADINVYCTNVLHIKLYKAVRDECYDCEGDWMSAWLHLRLWRRADLQQRDTEEPTAEALQEETEESRQTDAFESASLQGKKNIWHIGSGALGKKERNLIRSLYIGYK